MQQIKLGKSSAIGRDLTATQRMETNLSSKIQPKKVKDSVLKKTQIPNKLEDHFKENFKKIVDNIVTQTQSRLGNVNDLQIEQENGVKEKMRDYFKGQNLHELKLKLFFNRWSAILKEPDEEEQERLIDLGRATKEKEDAKGMDLRDTGAKGVKGFELSS